MSRETNELKFEKQLYDYLSTIGGTKQWQKMDHLKTTDDLWNNFRKIAYQLNQDKLNQPLSDVEFNQLKKQLLEQTKTPYHAGVFLYGVNGKTQVEIDRDDGKHVFLTLFDQDQIGAGNTIYQVTTQIKLKNKLPGKKNRRFDTTLLINGLPIIQIEEKADGHSAKEALNQMHQYQAERQYTDIFSTIQILVALTPHDARYMANTTTEAFNTDFAFQWKKNGSKQPPIMDWREFADQFLSIPMAHKMATNFMILDNTPNRQSIKVMRYYQVYATQTVIEKLKHHDFDYNNKGDNQKVGYIWHTTGSGKTISSFKTAFLASRLPNVDKVVFLVDRIALTNQTANEYKAYDPNADSDNQGGVVADTSNVRDLKQKLRSNKRSDIVVTSTQKMYRLIYKDKFSMSQKNIVFIVDEAHRSTSGEMLQEIKKAFKKSAWIGYTGTPNFDPKDGPTTDSIFGPPLHRYVISDAIADHNVLGFQVDFKTTLPPKELREKYLPKYFHHRYPEWSDVDIKQRINSLTPADMDETLQPSVYDMNESHVQEVVTDILDHWKSRSVEGRYNAMLTTHVGGNKPSIPMAMMYYNEFQKQMQKMDQPLKVAVTFSQNTSNNDSQLKTNQILAKAMSDYNQIFNTQFNDKSVSEYVEDLVSRLNRTASDKNYLDLVIVVDQLLTGFDAPQLNVLYVDRTLKGANLIQAYSRTNRIQNMQYKPYGRVVNYRWPANNEKLMKQALAVYSNPDSADYQGKIPIPKNLLAKPYKSLIKELRETVKSLSDLTNNFTAVPRGENAQEEAYQQLNKYNRQVTKAKQYDEFDRLHPEKFYNAINFDEDKEARLTGGIADDLKKKVAKIYGVEVIDLTLRMEQVKEVTVNYDYLHQLIANYANKLNDESVSKKETNQLKNKIYQMLNSLEKSDKRYANQIRDFIESDLKKDGELRSPLKPEEVDLLIKKHGKNWSTEQLHNFIQQWGLGNYQDKQQIKKLVEQHQVGNPDDLKKSGVLDKIIKFGMKNYQRDGSLEIQKLKKIKYHNKLNEAFQKLADNIKKHF